MAMAVAVGGFSPGEADALRRAMGAWRKQGTLGGLTERLVDGMRANGIADEFAEQICEQIRGFGEYGFPESHAASFARLVYVSSWLKCHYPGAFCAALLNSQPMGFYSARSLIDDARRHGVSVRPVDIQHSHFDNIMEPDGAGTWAIRRDFARFAESSARPPRASRTHVRTDTSPVSHHCRSAQSWTEAIWDCWRERMPCAAWQTTDDRPSGPCKGCMTSPCFEDFSDPILSHSLTRARQKRCARTTASRA